MSANSSADDLVFCRFNMKHINITEKKGGTKEEPIKEKDRGGKCVDWVERKRTSCLLLMGSSSARLVCSLVA